MFFHEEYKEIIYRIKKEIINWKIKMLSITRNYALLQDFIREGLLGRDSHYWFFFQAHQLFIFSWDASFLLFFTNKAHLKLTLAIYDYKLMRKHRDYLFWQYTSLSGDFRFSMWSRVDLDIGLGWRGELRLLKI